MDNKCRSSGCKLGVPVELTELQLCPQHFTLSIEQACADMRRETAKAPPDPARHASIVQYLARTGETLSRLATGNARLPDEMKARILNTFLTLMNLRENLDRVMTRAAMVAGGPQVSAGKR